MRGDYSMNENKENVETEIDEMELNKLMQVRLDKLKQLQEAGKDPFEITKYDRTELSEELWEKPLFVQYKIVKEKFKVI